MLVKEITLSSKLLLFKNLLNVFIKIINFKFVFQPLFNSFVNLVEENAIKKSIV